MVIKVFYSREDRMGEILDENDRVQYNDLGQDTLVVEKSLEYLQDCLDGLDEKTEDFLASLEEYVEEASEEHRAGMDICRADAVEAWADTQVALSRVAYTLRIDGNEAFHRMIDGLKGKQINMQGL